jgi:hypothetical protein
MDGKGRWMDNVFMERLWWSVKYQDVYLKAYSSIAEVRKGAETILSSITVSGGFRALTEGHRMMFTGVHYIRCR